MIIAKIQILTDGLITGEYDRKFDSEIDMKQYIKEANENTDDMVVVKEHKNLLVE